MATPTMVRTIELPAGTAPRQVDAYLRLIADTVDAWGEATGDNVSVGGTRHAHPDGAGVLSFANVRPNSGASADVIDNPADTYYELTVKFPDGTRIVDYFTAPDSAGTYQIADYLNSSPTAPTSLFSAYVQRAGDTMTGDLSAGTAKFTFTTMADGDSARELFRWPATSSSFRITSDNYETTGNGETHYDHVFYMGWNIAQASLIDNARGGLHIALEDDFWTNSGFDSAWHHQCEGHIQMTFPGGSARRVFSSSGDWATKQTDTALHGDYFSLNEGGTGASNGSPTTARQVIYTDPTGVLTVNRKTLNMTAQDTSNPITAIQLNYAKDTSNSQSYVTLYSHSNGRGEFIWADDAAAGTEYWRLGRNGSTDLKLRDHIAPGGQRYHLVFVGGDPGNNSTTAYGRFIAQGESGQAVPVLESKTSGGTQTFAAYEDGSLKFFNGTGSTEPTITGSRGGNAALASLLTALATLGLVTDSTS